MHFRPAEHFSEKIAEARPVSPVFLLTLANISLAAVERGRALTRVKPRSEKAETGAHPNPEDKSCASCIS
jgi:hypothetical protein